MSKNTPVIAGYDQLARLIADSLSVYLAGLGADAVAGINPGSGDQVYVIQAGGDHYMVTVEMAHICRVVEP